MKYFWTVILAFSFIALWCNPKADVISTNGPPAFHGEVVYLEGEVWINGELADFGSSVEFGDYIETSIHSYCEIQFLQKNIFRISEESQVLLSYSENQAHLEMEKGSLTAIMNRLDLLTGENPFLVMTPTTTAGIRGTSFFMRVDNEDRSYVCACYGYVSIVDTKGAELAPLKSYHHKAVWITQEEGEVIIEEAPLLFHDDEDLNTLAERLDYRVPWDNY